MVRERDKLPILSQPRGEYSVSLLDALFQALWKDANDLAWPERSFREIGDAAEKKLGRSLHPASIRGTVYRRADLFERVGSEKGGLKWRLTKKARNIM